MMFECLLSVVVILLFFVLFCWWVGKEVLREYIYKYIYLCGAPFLHRRKGFVQVHTDGCIRS